MTLQPLLLLSTVKMQLITLILVGWVAVASALPTQADSGVSQMRRHHFVGRHDLMPGLEPKAKRHHIETQDDLMPDVES